MLLLDGVAVTVEEGIALAEISDTEETVVENKAAFFAKGPSSFLLPGIQSDFRFNSLFEDISI